MGTCTVANRDIARTFHSALSPAGFSQTPRFILLPFHVDKAPHEALANASENFVRRECHSRLVPVVALAQLTPESEFFSGSPSFNNFITLCKDALCVPQRQTQFVRATEDECHLPRSRRFSGTLPASSHQAYSCCGHGHLRQQRQYDPGSAPSRLCRSHLSQHGPQGDRSAIPVACTG